MDFVFNTIFWILLFNFLIVGGVSVYSYLKGYTKGHVYFTFMMIMIAEWAFSASIESAVTSLSSKVVWSSIEYIGACTCAVFFFRYSLGFSAKTSRWFNRNMYIFWIFPALIIILAFTNKYHHLIWKGFEWSEAGNNILVYHHGIGFFGMIVYSLLLVLLSIVLIVRALPNMPVVYRGQARFVILAGVFPFIATFLYAIGISPLEGLDITVISFVLTGLILLFGIYRYQIFHILPLARHKIAEIMQDGVLITDQDYKILYSNSSAMRLLNLDDRSHFSDLRDIQWLYDFCAGQLANNQSESELKAGETEVWFRISLAVIQDSNSQKKGFLIVLHDITSRKILENESQNLIAELHNSQKELVELNSQKDKLMSIIAHDLRTPFHQILSFARLLSEDIDIFTPEEVKLMATSILQAGDMGAGILEDLLAWARSQRNSTEVKPEEVHPDSIIAEILPVFDMAARDKNLHIVVEGHKNLRLIANRNILSIVIRNLLANAIKFSHHSGMILIKLETSGEKGLIHIVDSGIGIPPEDLPKLFNINIKYTRTGTSGEAGTGLGLILCKDLITRSNGELSVTSVVGKGSTFTVSLPIA